jgi:hypothetical protein
VFYILALFKDDQEVVLEGRFSDPEVLDPWFLPHRSGECGQNPSLFFVGCVSGFPRRKDDLEPFLIFENHLARGDDHALCGCELQSVGFGRTERWELASLSKPGRVRHGVEDDLRRGDRTVTAQIDLVVRDEVLDLEGDHTWSTGRGRGGGQEDGYGLVQTFCELLALRLGQRVRWVEEDYCRWVPTERVLGERVCDRGRVRPWTGRWNR